MTEIVRPGEGSPTAPSVDATLEWWASVRNEGGPTDGGVISMFGVLADEVVRLRSLMPAVGDLNVVVKIGELDALRRVAQTARAYINAPNSCAEAQETAFFHLGTAVDVLDDIHVTEANR